MNQHTYNQKSDQQRSDPPWVTASGIRVFGPKDAKQWLMTHLLFPDKANGKAPGAQVSLCREDMGSWKGFPEDALSILRMAEATSVQVIFRMEDNKVVAYYAGKRIDEVTAVVGNVAKLALRPIYAAIGRALGIAPDALRQMTPPEEVRKPKVAAETSALVEGASAVTGEANPKPEPAPAAEAPAPAVFEIIDFQVTLDEETMTASGSAKCPLAVAWGVVPDSKKNSLAQGEGPEAKFQFKVEFGKPYKLVFKGPDKDDVLTKEFSWTKPAKSTLKATLVVK